MLSFFYIVPFLSISSCIFHALLISETIPIIFQNNVQYTLKHAMVCHLLCFICGYAECILSITFRVTTTETKMSSFWRNFHHWLHWKLSFWQLPVLPVMIISSKWRHFRFSDTGTRSILRLLLSTEATLKNAELSRLPWIFPGASLIFNGIPGNIQGNLPGVSMWGNRWHESIKNWYYKHSKTEHNKTMCIFYGIYCKCSYQEGLQACNLTITNTHQIARFMGPTWGPSGADRTQVGPMLAPWTLLSGTPTTIHTVEPLYNRVFFFSKIGSQKTLYISPVRARCGMSFVSLWPDLYQEHCAKTAISGKDK